MKLKLPILTYLHLGKNFNQSIRKLRLPKLIHLVIEGGFRQDIDLSKYPKLRLLEIDRKYLYRDKLNKFQGKNGVKIVFVSDF